MRYTRSMQESPVDPESPKLGAILEPHRAALQLHCYRMTGSLQDAEDLAQEALLRAWRNYAGFKGASSLRTWLYRIATNVCLDALKKRRSRRLRPDSPASDPHNAVGAPTEEVLWLEPYPDSELIDAGAGPEDQLLMREDISLAFIAALQLLPPRQRAILILKDVLDWQSNELAEWLNTSVSAVESALHRARTTLASNQAPEQESSAPLDNPSVKDLLERYMSAWEANDLNELMDLLHEEATLSMPPFSSWYQGREAVRTILGLHPLGPRRRAGWRLAPTAANSQPAFVLYRADQPGEAYNAFGLMVLAPRWSPESCSVAALTIFRNTAIVTGFGFPLVANFPEKGQS
jgi:RNA polymerase sigma-70 factor, ECF subfamily